MSQVLLGKDGNAVPTYALPVSQNIRRTTLSANTAQPVTIPLGCTSVFFSYSNGVDVWVEFKTATAAQVPGGAFAAATSELNPIARYGLTPGATLSCISPTTAYVEAAFY